MDRFPDRFCLNLPCLPFKRVQNDLIYLCLSSWRGRPGESELMYCAQCDCIKYQDFAILFKSSPFSTIVYVIFLFKNRISLILIVRSSSFEREFVSIILGLMQTGGTTKCSIIKSLISEVPPMFTRINCSFGMLSRIFLAYRGLS